MKKKLLLNGEEVEAIVKSWGEENLEIEFQGESYHFSFLGDHIEFKDVKREFYSAKVLPKETKQVFVGDLEAEVLIVEKTQKASTRQAGAGSLQSPMPGKIFKVLKEQGQTVELGEPILILEAMKMEHTIKARQKGVVKEIHFKEGEQVQGGVELCEIEPIND